MQATFSDVIQVNSHDWQCLIESNGTGNPEILSHLFDKTDILIYTYSNKP